ncbi:hypothetical protein MMPV_004584 [Pyropia vietnamensis]
MYRAATATASATTIATVITKHRQAATTGAAALWSAAWRRAATRSAAGMTSGGGGGLPPPFHVVGSPSARGQHTAGWERIHLTGLTFHARHGVFPAEQALGQRFVVDVMIDARLDAVTVARAAGAGGGTTPPATTPEATTSAGTLAAARTMGTAATAVHPPFQGVYADRVSQTLDYSAVYATVARVVTAEPPAALVESLAAAVADGVLATQPLAIGVWVRVAKPHVALGGVLDSVGVEVYRVRVGLCKGMLPVTHAVAVTR